MGGQVSLSLSFPVSGKPATAITMAIAAQVDDSVALKRIEEKKVEHTLKDTHRLPGC